MVQEISALISIHQKRLAFFLPFLAHFSRMEVGQEGQNHYTKRYRAYQEDAEMPPGRAACGAQEPRTSPSGKKCLIKNGVL
jgi:hypothetical protein